MAGNKQKGASKLIIILILLVFVLMLTGTGAALYLAGIFDSGDDTPPVAVSQLDDQASSVPQPPPGGPPIYKELERLTVNLGAGQEGGRVRVLQTTVQVMARHQPTLDGLDDHMPMVRNSLILLYSSQDYDELLTRDGKESLREQTKAEINEILMRQRVPGEVEGVFFTSFVMQ